MTQRSLATGVAALAAGFNLVFGVWAFVAPASFFDNIAMFPPYNEHLLHDVGAFQVGLGAVLALAVVGWPALAATLGGVAAGSVLHAVAHVIDRDQGGRDSDPIGLALVAAVLVVAAVLARPRSGDRRRALEGSGGVRAR